MGPRFIKLAALVAVVIGAGVACAPPPTPTPPFVVTTTADTFDGVCDTDCSIRDAVAASNVSPLIAGLPNRISVPAGDYTLSPAEPIVVTRQVALTGSYGLTVVDVSGATVTAPNGIFEVRASLILNGITFNSDAATPTHVLASCTPELIRGVSVFNLRTTNLAAVTSICDTTLVTSVITGPTTALQPHTLNANSSTVPFDSTPLTPLRFSLISAIVTGPSSSDGTTQAATLNVQPRTGLSNVPVDFTGTRFVGIGIQLGGINEGSILSNSISTSFDMDGPSGPTSFTIAEGSRARIVNSTVYGGGPAGTIVVDGTLNAESVTFTTNGPSIVAAPTATATLRRSIVSATGSPCLGPVTSLGYNAVVGSCATPVATDVSVASEAALELSALDRHGNPTPSLHRLPAATSPVVDAIPPGGLYNLDCPVDLGQGRSIDARGILRPSGAGCDIGSLEFFVAPPVDPPAEPPAT